MNALHFVLIAGVLLRIITAIAYPDVVFPDEHFQTIEPANNVVNGFGWLAWEWYHGARSWIIPGLYMPLLAVLKFFGIQGGPASVFACRVFTAMFSASSLWALLRIVRALKLSSASQLTVIALAAFSPALIAWAPTTFSETWATAFLWWGMALCLEELYGKSRPQRAFVSGLMLGLACICRIQLAAWMIGLAGAVLLMEREFRRTYFKHAIIGFVAGLFVLAVVDTGTYGAPFFSAFKNFKMSIFDGVAAMNGVSPWYDYLPRTWRNLGPFYFLLVVVAPLVAFASLRIRLKREDLLVLIPTLVFIVGHSVIGHKETRFIVPAFGSFFYFFARLAMSIETRWPHFLPVWDTSIARAPVAIACLALSFTVWPLIHTDRHYERSDLASLTLLAYKDGALKRNPNACLLLVDHYFIWTRGEMALGQNITFKDTPRHQLTDEQLSNCVYAMMPGYTDEWFAARSKWQRLGNDHWGNVLYKNPKFGQ